MVTCDILHCDVWRNSSPSFSFSTEKSLKFKVAGLKEKNNDHLAETVKSRPSVIPDRLLLLHLQPPELSCHVILSQGLCFSSSPLSSFTESLISARHCHPWTHEYSSSSEQPCKVLSLLYRWWNSLREVKFTQKLRGRERSRSLCSESLG